MNLSRMTIVKLGEDWKVVLKSEGREKYWLEPLRVTEDPLKVAPLGATAV